MRELALKHTCICREGGGEEGRRGGGEGGVVRGGTFAGRSNCKAAEEMKCNNS
jgi:hypothetical protein